MSTGKLDQSLDDILKTRRTSTRRGRAGRRTAGRPVASEAPVGGVQKSTKQAKQAKPVPTAPAATSGSGESKIMISNLPLDVEEAQLKDYFQTAVQGIGKPKRVLMQYGPTGRSLGSATVIFGKPDHAAKAVQALNNVRIDNRLIRVEVIVSARDAPAPAAQPSLADRVTQPKKDKPKPATATKATAAGTRGRGGTRGRARGRGGRNPRDKKKTLEELDAEMEDYFPTGDGGQAAAATAGGAVNGGGGDTNMDDEML